MARTNVYIPDELAATVKRELPDLNLSQVVRETLIGLLHCEHHELVCASCSARISRAEVVDGPLSSFWAALMDELELLALRGGTAEGAARVLRRVGQAHGATRSRRPLPRPTRAERRSAQVREMFPDDMIPRRATA